MMQFLIACAIAGALLGFICAQVFSNKMVSLIFVVIGSFAISTLIRVLFSYFGIF